MWELELEMELELAEDGGLGIVDWGVVYCPPLKLIGIAMPHAPASAAAAAAAR